MHSVQALESAFLDDCRVVSRLTAGKKAMPSPIMSQEDSGETLGNFPHPSAHARGPWRSPGTATTTASSRRAERSHKQAAPRGSPTRGSCRTGPLRGERCDHSPRGGSEPLLQRRSTKLTARLTQRDEGQHKTPQGSHNTAKTQRRHARRANKRAAQDGRRQQDVEPLRFRTKRVDRQPPQPHARPPTRLRSVHT